MIEQPDGNLHENIIETENFWCWPWTFSSGSSFIIWLVQFHPNQLLMYASVHSLHPERKKTTPERADSPPWAAFPPASTAIFSRKEELHEIKIMEVILKAVEGWFDADNFLLLGRYNVGSVNIYVFHQPPSLITKGGGIISTLTLLERNVMKRRKENRNFQGEGKIASRFIFSFAPRALTIMCDGISFSFRSSFSRFSPPTHRIVFSRKSSLLRQITFSSLQPPRMWRYLHTFECGGRLTRGKSCQNVCGLIVRDSRCDVRWWAMTHFSTARTFHRTPSDRTYLEHQPRQLDTNFFASFFIPRLWR